MVISNLAKQKIFDEYKIFEQKQYNGKSKKERKKLNQFFTPPELSIKIIENLDNLNGTIIDPCNGAGNLTMAAAIVKFCDLNEKPLNVFGYDIDDKMIELVINRFNKYFGIDFSNNFKHKDSTQNWTENFDTCLTNPPFNKNGGDLLELAIIKNIIEKCKTSSILCTVTNITDINGPLKQGKKWEKYCNVLDGKLESIEIIPDSQTYFGIDLAKDLGILKILDHTDKDYNDFRFIKNGINYKFVYDKVYKMVVKSNIGLNLRWTNENAPYAVPLKVLVSKNNYNLVTYKLTQTKKSSSFKPTTSKTNSKNDSNISKNVVFDTPIEADNFRKTCMTKFYKFLVKHALTSQNIKNVNKFIPFLGYKKVWTDDMLYKYFNLTQDEIKIIERELL